MAKMEKKRFRIGELSKKLHLESSVIRFWEKEFAISAQRSDGQQRYYTEEDFNKFSLIKELLHVKKFTIAGAKIELSSNNNSNFIPTSKEVVVEKIKVVPSKLEKDIIELQRKLIKLRELL